MIGEQVEWGTEDDTPGSAFADGLKSGEVLCKYDVILNVIDLAQPALSLKYDTLELVPRWFKRNGRITV